MNYKNNKLIYKYLYHTMQTTQIYELYKLHIFALRNSFEN